jgi:hypothetical protein
MPKRSRKPADLNRLAASIVGDGTDEDEGVVAERAAGMREIASDAAGRWVEPYRSTDHGDLLYDVAGLPR